VIDAGGKESEGLMMYDTAAELYCQVVEVFGDYVLNEEQLAKIQDLVGDITGSQPRL
jgi:hypothetical protein